MQNFRLMFAILYISIVVLSPACATLQKPWQTKHATVIKDEVTKAHSHVAGGEYNKALELYAQIYSLYREQEVINSYLRAGDQIRSAADLAYQKKDFPKAGAIYKILIESRIIDQNFAKSLSFNYSYLKRQLGACSKTLTEIGFLKYREQKLDEAITIWEKVLVFDPDNDTAKKAIITAHKQLHQLNSLR